MNESADKGRKDGKRGEKALKQQRQEIFLHAGELSSEMNLRLMLDGEVGLGREERMLFVESVIVTGITYPAEHRIGFLGRAKLLLKRIFTYMARLLHLNH